MMASSCKRIWTAGIGVFVTSLLLGAGSSAAWAKPILLLTGFEPFGGSPRNNSWLTVEELARNPDLTRRFDVRTCLLPVEYDRAAARALDCEAKLPQRPAAVVSFGEAACKIQLERVYANWDDTPGYPDNAGVERSGVRIDPAGPESRGPTLSLDRMMASVAQADRSLVVFSRSAGNYVCNNTAYLLARGFEGRVPFAFLHVPNTRCAPDESDPSRLGRLVGDMIERATYWTLARRIK